MKKYFCLYLILISVFTFPSCTKPKGIWDDNIRLSTNAVTFNASADSVTIKTGGTSWLIMNISVDTAYFYNFTGIDVLSDNYTIKQDCFLVRRSDKNTLFIRADANPRNVERVITVFLAAGDFFDKVKVTQRSK